MKQSNKFHALYIMDSSRTLLRVAISLQESERSVGEGHALFEYESQEDLGCEERDWVSISEGAMGWAFPNDVAAETGGGSRCFLHTPHPC